MSKKIWLDSSGSFIEPDEGPRDSRFHKRIVSAKKMAGTRGGNTVMLECGHGVLTFGDLAHAKGVVLCTKCRDLEKS